jgi:glycosyltransferase involved in cell wall biosynthesis
MVADPEPNSERVERGTKMAVAPGGTRAITGDWVPDTDEMASEERTQDPRSVSVVVTTRGNRTTLERCLRSVLDSDYEDFDVIVVDHGSPSPDTPRMLVTQFPGERRLRYLEEPWSSASMARNAALAQATATVVAFLDDDVVVDPYWIRRSIDALLAEADVVCVTGRSASPQVRDATGFAPELRAEGWEHRTYRRAEGWERRTYRQSDTHNGHPLLACTAGGLGAGAGTVILASVARELGGFDVALGPATPACGGEHIDLLVRLLRRGYTISYEPTAIVWREHPAGAQARRRQIYRYGIGLGAIISKRLIAGPARRAWLGAIPAAVRYARDPAPQLDGDKLSRYPLRLRWLMRLGLLLGPFAYLWSAFLVRARRGRRTRTSTPESVRIVRRLVVGGETINVVWFDDSAEPRTRFSWRSHDEATTSDPASELLADAAIELVLPATTDDGAPRISAVVPARNAEQWIESCVSAIRANGPAEIILVDGGSTDRTVELAQPWIDKVIDDGGAGVAAARMMGVASASQPWVALVDADVVLPSNALRDLDRERRARHLVALQAGLHSVGAGDYWSQALANHHNGGKSRQWFGVCASLVSRDVLLANPLDADLASGEDIDLRIRLTTAGFPIGVSETMIGQHRFGTGFGFAGQQWLADGAGLGRMVRKHGRAALLNAMVIPFAAAALGLVRGVSHALRTWPYFAGFAVGNYVGLWRGLLDRSVPAPSSTRKVLVGGMVAWLAALPVLVAAGAAGLGWLLFQACHAAYDGHLLLVILATLAVAIPLEVGKGAGDGRFASIARSLAPFAAWAMMLALLLSAVRLAKVVGL